MAETKATPVKKTERKKPVRTAPAQKDYPNKLAWLKAMTEHEEKQAEATTSARVARLEKRLASKQSQRDKLQTEINELTREIEKLAPLEVDQAAVAEAGLPQG